VADGHMGASAPHQDPHRRSAWRVRPRLLLIVPAICIFAIGILVGLLLYGQVGGDKTAALSDSSAKLGEMQKALSASEDRNWTYSRANDALKAQLQDLQGGAAASTTTTTKGALGSPATYADGVYLVGRDIVPGDYDGVTTGGVGYWARLSATDGSTHAIITNGLPRGPFVLTILPADKAVELLGVKLTAR
jgi:hypothetical protein